MNRRIGAWRAAQPWLLGLLGLFARTEARGADPAGAQSSEPLAEVVVTATPLSGSNLNLAAVPAPVQVATSRDIERSHATDLAAFMSRMLGSVYVNQMQENPLQPDLNFRGYTASPVLGTPEGMSVYLDGMRLNQPFGDVVSWDLIPRAAIASMELMPGSNPLFGQNTLGGAVSIQTKDGWSDPGLAMQLAYGSHAQRTAVLEYGEHTDDGLSWYINGDRFKDAGWRAYSPSDADQLFGKLGWKSARTKITLSAAWAKSDLSGNGLQESRLLARDYDSVYTTPDETVNNSRFVELALTHAFDAGLSLSASSFYRAITTQTLNGDVNDDSLGQNLYQPDATEQGALAAASYSGFPTSGEANTPFPQWRCIADVLLVAAGAQPKQTCNGIDTATHSAQHEIGISAQLTWITGSDALRSTLMGGLSLGESGTHFTQSARLGYLTPQRAITIVNCPGAAVAPNCDDFIDGTEISGDGTPIDARVDLTGRASTRSVFVSDVLAVGAVAHLTVSARYDHTSIRNRDGISPVAGASSLTADNSFGHLNPAVGATVHLASWIEGYGSWNQSSRAPSSIELGCDDPANPCRLPNAMAGDPPGALRQVVAQTVELGVRGSAGPILAWSAGVFRSNNRDDIMFVSNTVSGAGYFTNFGDTRRQGIELSASGQAGAVRLGANFTLLDATYRSSQVIQANGNSSNDSGSLDAGNIRIHPGDRIPLVPRQVLKTWAEWDLTRRLSLDADLLYTGWSYARGNENNAHQPDGVYFLGPGYSGGYLVANLGIEFRPIERLKLFLQVDNLFDRHYATASLLSTTSFTANGNFVSYPFGRIAGQDPQQQVASTFYSPGAPRSLFGGVRYQFW